MSKWMEKAANRPIASGNFLAIVNGLDYRLQFVDFDDDSVQDVMQKKPGYIDPNAVSIKYWYKVKLTKVGIANQAYAEVAKAENSEKFEKALKQQIDSTYTLEISQTGSKQLGKFCSENFDYLLNGGVFKMVRTGSNYNTNYLFSIPAQGSL